MPQQKQKQKQTVIVNIGSVVGKKRKRKPRKKKASGGSSRMPPPPPPPPTPFTDLRQVLYPPQPPMRVDDNLAVQLNSVTKQLQDLQDKQQNRTANLMAGARAIAREEGAQGAVMESQELPLSEPKAKAKRKAKLKVVEQPEPVASLSPVARPEPVASLSPEPSVSRGRKSRSDKGKPRGPTMRTASREALKHGHKLVAVSTTQMPTILGGNTPDPEPSGASAQMVFN